MFDKTDAVSFLHEKCSPSLGHGKTPWTFRAQACCLLPFEQACSVWGEVGKGYSIFKCLQTVRIDVICLFVCWYFVYNASYALRKNKFLTFLIVIQLVCFVGVFLLIFSVVF